MPIALVLLGLILVISGIKGTQDKFFDLIKSDFEGGQNNNGFLSWMLAIGAIVAIGYYKPIRPISNGLLILVFVVIFLSNRGIASNFVTQTSNVRMA